MRGPGQSVINVQSQNFYFIHFGNKTIFMGDVYILMILIFTGELYKMRFTQLQGEWIFFKPFSYMSKNYGEVVL
jgi:hypothetical protein